MQHQDQRRRGLMRAVPVQVDEIAIGQPQSLTPALEARRPRARYRVTRPTTAAAFGRRVLPTAALDWFARRS